MTSPAPAIVSLPSTSTSPAPSITNTTMTAKHHRPSLNPISTAAPRTLHLPALSSAPLASISNIPSLSPPTSPPASALPARRKQPARRQSSISYRPHDSPRSWSLGRSASISSPLSAVKPRELREARPSTAPGKPPATEPTVLTLAEKHADLLQFIAQKESKCLDLRSQLAVHESELRALKQKWERIVHREFGRTQAPPTPSSAVSPASKPTSLAPPVLGTKTTTAVVDGIVGGMRMLAAAVPIAPSDPLPSLAARPSPFAKRVARQSMSGSSSTTSASVSIATPRTSLASSPASSPDVEHTVVQREELMVRDTGATPTFSPNPAFVSATSPSPVLPAKSLRRRSRDDPSKHLADVPPTPTVRDDRKRLSGGLPPASSIPGMGSIGVAGMQGWVDTVGKGWADLQRGKTFSKSQKRASVLFADVSQSIFAALAPPAPAAPRMESLLDEDDMPDAEDGHGKALGEVMTPDTRAVNSQDDDDEDWNW
ncbi:hypothetical protein BV25DRAFT_1553708 [Artomyces pyxidatus]|uniref:Uncharacterized protein n=1 Tax=Artomyces pyxidatus TaxID=48021 RepID=A0ACB8SKH0_9AGAM|nr:hypothetical protein BV25DRAFT_1553708 [Artomyces pyxidatus]